MTIQLTFKITLLADYHTSAGQRAGYTVDSSLLRDHNGSPVLRGTMLNGLLRDAWETLVSEINSANIQSAHWHEEELNGITARLFGFPGIRKLWRYRSTTLLHNNKSTDSRWGSEDVARVRMDPRTRRAKPQQLFIQEEGDSRLSFYFTATCPGADETDRQDAAALVAAARQVRHMGAARRRGRGECRLHLVEAKGFVEKAADETWTEAGLQAFKTYWLEGSTLPKLKANENTTAPKAIPQETKRFRMFVRLQEPVLIADKSQKANAFETLTSIPGTAVLGSLATRAARTLRISDLPDERHKLFTEMFLRGGVRVTGLLPLIETKIGKIFPTITAPLSWEQCETHPLFGEDVGEETHPVRDQLKDRQRQCEICGSKLKSLMGYLTLSTKPELIQVAKREEIHPQMDNRTGRVKEGDLFTYIMIDSGQWFGGELTCSAEFWPEFSRLTGVQPGETGELLLGKAVRRGYGLTHVYLEEISEDQSPIWIQKSINQRLPEMKEPTTTKTQHISLLFLTDTILVDTWGRYHRGITNQLLKSLLKLPASSDLQITDQIIKSRRIDTFNTYRRISGWRDEAIMAGSVVQFKITVEDYDALTTQMDHLERGGIGLRTNEGFGQIAFNHPLLESTPENKSLPLARTTKMEMKGQLGKAHHLQFAAEFRSKWAGTMESMTGWRELKTIDGNLARLIALYQYRPLAELQRWMEMKKGTPQRIGKSRLLWGEKPLKTREKTVPLNPEVLALINNLLFELADHPQDLHPIGLGMLAERMGAVIEENEGGII
jgi:CRISPR-associated protein Csx10